MADKIQEFLTAYTAKIQGELVDLAEATAYTTATHVARGGIAGLFEDVRQAVEDDVAITLEID